MELEEEVVGLKAEAGRLQSRVECVAAAQEEQAAQAAEAEARAAGAGAAVERERQGRQAAERELSSLLTRMVLFDDDLCGVETLLIAEVTDHERQLLARHSEAEVLQLKLDASEAKRILSEVRLSECEADLRLKLQISQDQCLELRKEIEISNEAAQQVWARLEYTDTLLQLLATRASESESNLSALESVNSSEMLARFNAEQELLHTRFQYEEHFKQLQADALSAPQEVARVAKELFESENALQTSAVEIARCHNEIAERHSELERAQAKIVLLQQELADSNRLCSLLTNEAGLAKADVHSEYHARLSTERQLFEVQDQLQQFSQLFASEVRCAREGLCRTSAALASSDAEVLKLHQEMTRNRESLMDREKQLYVALEELKDAHSQLSSVKSLHQTEIYELNCKIEALQRDTLSAKTLAESNYKSGVRIAELEEQLERVLRTLWATESLLSSS
jgi:hypothetical protein